MEISSLQNDPWSAGASRAREQLLEHQFLAEIVRRMLLAGRRCEVLRAEFDASGHDVVLEADGVLRHVQLKAMRADGRRMEVNIHAALAAKPSGCVVWMLIDPATLVADEFLWFGAEPGQPLPNLGDRMVRHSKGNALGVKAARPDLREVRRSRFERIAGYEGLIEKLFGTDSQRDIVKLKRHLREQLPVPITAPAWLALVQLGRFDALPVFLDEDEQIAFAHLIDGYALGGLNGADGAAVFVASVKADLGIEAYIEPSRLWVAFFLEHRRLRFEGRPANDVEKSLLNQMEDRLRNALRS